VQKEFKELKQKASGFLVGFFLVAPKMRLNENSKVWRYLESMARRKRLILQPRKVSER